MIVRSNGADILYAVQGSGAPVVLLHPFPASHSFWLPVAEQLAPDYKLIMPDLRGMGASGVGDGPATMYLHADDIRRVCDELSVRRAVFVGVSIGGYILFEFWRRFRERVTALAFCNTKAPADTDEARKGRQQAAETVMERGPEFFIDAQLPKLIGRTTQKNRPDLVSSAKSMMMSSTAKGIAAAQLGMASRPDSLPTLATISVPTLFLGGTDDVLSPPDEIRRMHSLVAGSELRIITDAGHYSAFEKPIEFASILREFLRSIEHSG